MIDKNHVLILKQKKTNAIKFLLVFLVNYLHSKNFVLNF